MKEGRTTGAVWGRLEGIEAVLAMMDVKTGTFRFSERAPSELSGDGDSEIEIQKVMFNAAWLMDELSRWPEVSDHSSLTVREGAEKPAPPLEWNSVPIDAVFDDIRSNPGISIDGLEAMERWSPKTIALAVRFMVHGGRVEVDAKKMENLQPTGVGAGDFDSAVGAVIKAVKDHGFSMEIPHVLILVEPTVYGAFLQARQSLSPENLAVSGESMTAAWQGGRIATLALRGPGTELVLHVVSLESTGAMKQVKARMADYPAVMAWVGSPEKMEDLAWFFEWVDNAPTEPWGVLCAAGLEAATWAAGALKWKKRWLLHVAAITSVEDLLRVLADGSAASKV